MFSAEDLGRAGADVVVADLAVREVDPHDFALGVVLDGSPQLFDLLQQGGDLGRLFGGLRFRLHRLAQPLDALPDAARDRRVVLELLGWLDARQAVPDGDQALRRPILGKFRELLLAKKRDLLGDLTGMTAEARGAEPGEPGSHRAEPPKYADESDDREITIGLRSIRSARCSICRSRLNMKLPACSAARSMALSRS